MSRGEATLVKRMARHNLTAESLLENGSTLAERFIYHAKRFHFNDYEQNVQLGQLNALLSTCENPSGKAATWLRALLEQPSEELSLEQQFLDLDAALKEKLKEPLNDAVYERLKWATLALRGADAISNGERLTPEEQKAASHLAATAFSALPETMNLCNTSMLQTRNEERGPRRGGGPNWLRMRIHYSEMCRSFDESATMEAAMLPFQLWLVSEFDGCSLEDQKLAQMNNGLVPYTMLGHRAFQKAMGEQVPWPQDPRNDLLLEWHQRHNPLLAERVKSWMHASAMEVQTPATARPGMKHRL
jgi:hypothetical protein